MLRKLKFRQNNSFLIKKLCISIKVLCENIRRSCKSLNVTLSNKKIISIVFNSFIFTVYILLLYFIYGAILQFFYILILSCHLYITISLNTECHSAYYRSTFCGKVL